MIIYLIKLNLILTLLCLLFQVLMHRDTFFGVRRLMLWGIYLTAFLLPLWDVQGWLASDATANGMAEAYAHFVLPTLEVTAERVAGMGHRQNEPGCGMWFVGTMALWGLLYLIPVAWMTAKLLWQLAYILYIRCRCERVKGEKNISYYRYPRPCSPFSFGPWIFLHPDGMDRQTLREVLIHERAHVRGWHTLDILLSQAVCIIFWWNPAVWLMRREVRMNLEFIADKAVADYLMEMKNEESRFARNEESKLPASPEGDSNSSLFTLHSSLIKAYQYRLLGFSTQTNVATIANNFNVLPLKRRIMMMNLKRTSRAGMAKYALFVPVAAALLLISNVDSLARTIADNVGTPLALPEENALVQTQTGSLDLSQAHDPADEIKTVVQTLYETDDNIYKTVEQLPQYPGGQAALFQFIARNIRYPKAAQDWGVQGRVFVHFIVEKDGTLSDISASKVIDPESGQELPGVRVTAKTQKPTPEQVEVARHRAEGVKALKAEAERVVKAIPEKWTPGKQNGQPVRVNFQLPVSFRIQ